MGRRKLTSKELDQRDYALRVQYKQGLISLSDYFKSYDKKVKKKIKEGYELKNSEQGYLMSLKMGCVPDEDMLEAIEMQEIMGEDIF